MSMKESRRSYSSTSIEDMSSSFENSIGSFDSCCNQSDLNSEVFSEGEEEKEKLGSFSSKDGSSNETLSELEQSNGRNLGEISSEMGIALNCDERVSGLKQSVEESESMNAGNGVKIRTLRQQSHSKFTIVHYLLRSHLKMASLPVMTPLL
jgi:hypothetical protein